MSTVITIASQYTEHFLFEGFGDDEAEARAMLAAAWQEHCRCTPGVLEDTLDAYAEDVDIREVAVPSGQRDSEHVAMTWPTPRLKDIIHLAHDDRLGSECRVLTDDEFPDLGHPWHRKDEPWVHTPDYFSYDEVADLCRSIGCFAYVEQTGGGCATIYAGPLEDFENVYNAAGDTETEQRYKVGAGPGSYGWDAGPSVGNLVEFSVGPNDDGQSGEHVSPEDMGVTSTRQLAALIALYVIDAADFDNVTAIGLDATQRGITQKGARA